MTTPDPVCATSTAHPLPLHERVRYLASLTDDQATVAIEVVAQHIEDTYGECDNTRAIVRDLRRARP